MTSVIGSAVAGRHVPRAEGIPPSCVHQVYRAVNDWEKRTGRDAIRLDVGEPHFAPPQAAVEALAAAARDGRTGYTSAEGMTPLREALAAKLQARNLHSTNPGLVFVTPGASQGLGALMQSIANAGDEIVLPALHWPIHMQQSLLVGLRPVCYPLDEHFQPEVAAIERLATPRTRILLVNSPANPTGAVYDADRLAALLDLARRKDWQVISDEAYEDFVFDGVHVSMAALERGTPPERRRVFTAFSFSKSFAMTGYRLGYVVTPNRRAAETLQVVQEASILSSPTPVQYAGLAALESAQDIKKNTESVRLARNSLGPLADLGLLIKQPQGGWFALLDIGRTGMSAEDFAAALLEQQAVALAPGRGFALRPELASDGRILSIGVDPSATHYLRLAFCGAPDVVRDGVSRIAEWVRSLP